MFDTFNKAHSIIITEKRPISEIANLAQIYVDSSVIWQYSRGKIS